MTLFIRTAIMPALHWYIEGLQKRGPLHVSFEYRPIAFPRLSRDIETAIFRIVQESLTNIVRHAESKDARIDLTQNADNVGLRVRDFGKGIEGNKLGISALSGVGISGMKERVKQLGGELRVSRAEPGTLVEATIPIIESV
jgi:signal transduction histidine kinase